MDDHDSRTILTDIINAYSERDRTFETNEDEIIEQFVSSNEAIQVDFCRGMRSSRRVKIRLTSYKDLNPLEFFKKYKKLINSRVIHKQTSIIDYFTRS